MSDSIGAIHYDLDLQDDKFKSKVKGASGLMGGLKKQFQNAEASSKMLLVSVLALGVGMVSFAMKSVAAFNESNRAETELIQLHEKVSGATHKQTKELIALANQIQKKGVVEGDAIVKGQAQLATFKMSTDAIKKLTPAMTDMVAKQKGANATGEDFVNIGNLIGKVMEGNIGALGRYGVSFDDNQRKVLENGNQSERAAMLAKVLAQNYGGVNEALRNTPEGKMASIKNRWGDLQEQVGSLVLDAINPLIDQYDILMTDIENSGGILDYITKLFHDYEVAVYALTGAILVALTPALYAGAVAMWAFIAPLLPFLAIGAAIGLAVYAIVKAFGGWEPLMARIKLIFEQWWNVFGPLITYGLNGIVVAINTFLLPALKRLWDAIGPILIPALKVLGQIIGIVIATAIMVAILAINAIIVVVSLLIDVVIGLGKWIWKVILGIGPALKSGWKWFQDFLDKVGAFIEEIVKKFKSLPEWIKAGLSGMKAGILGPFNGVYEVVTGILKKIKDKINDALNPFVRHSPSLVDWVQKGANKMISTYSDMFSRLGSISAQNKVNLTGAVKSVSGQAETSKQGGFANGGTVNNFNINPSGIFARTPGEINDVAVQIVEAAKRVMNPSKVKIIR